jgi:hypothetical protein
MGTIGGLGICANDVVVMQRNLLLLNTRYQFLLGVQTHSIITFLGQKSFFFNRSIGMKLLMNAGKSSRRAGWNRSRITSVAGISDR